MTKTETTWTERVRRWRASGKTAEEFAGPEAFQASTLRYWASRLKHAGGRAPVSKAAEAESVRMVRVRRTSASRTSATAPLIVRVGDARVEVHAGFDEGVLQKVVAALGAAR